MGSIGQPMGTQRPSYPDPTASTSLDRDAAAAAAAHVAWQDRSLNTPLLMEAGEGGWIESDTTSFPRSGVRPCSDWP